MGFPLWLPGVVARNFHPWGPGLPLAGNPGRGTLAGGNSYPWGFLAWRSVSEIREKLNRLKFLPLGVILFVDTIWNY